MVVRIVTDSTSDLPKDLAQSLGIEVVPLKVLFGEETLRDGIDIDEQSFYRRLVASKTNPTTSQPTPGEFEEVYRRLGASGDPICVITISSKLSGTYSSAITAKGMVEPDLRVEVVDSLLVSMALGLVAIRAAKAAQSGASLEECVAIAKETSAKTEILFLVDTLEYLRRGGRIGGARAFLGTLLNIKPILGLKDGEVTAVERARTRQRGIDRLYEWAAAKTGVSALCVLASPPLDDAKTLAGRLRAHFADVPLYEGVLGPVVGTHAGPGVVGVAVYTGPRFD
ncbi:MAG: DegV family protein [Chloroflexota bacterium]|nr:DegV family protein [Dehalococcoidia bacterium]MDW8254113.1 DegV family protein [Chloroflexota bacterium]